MSVILSRLFLSRHMSRISSQTRSIFVSPSSKICCIISPHCSFDTTSQMPSHAKTRNSSLASSRGYTIISGSHITFCLFIATSGSHLKKKSPKPRLTARSPLIRLDLTNPPAVVIRSSSGRFDGLWSKLRGKDLPSRRSMALESPALAHMKCEGVITTAMQVEPERSTLRIAASSTAFPCIPVVSSCFSSSFFANSSFFSCCTTLNSASNAMNVLLNAFFKSSIPVTSSLDLFPSRGKSTYFLISGVFEKILIKFSPAYDDVRPPP
mmetsp:Transcript_12256/g.18797  ORF Transcript_12256/g.18797 Transcript_12256/m.18797 type:complete len:266 (-) Transcript_12256:263-1060(-)